MHKLTKKLPDKPGVYIFRGGKRNILYIGKATSLRSRVASYFRRDIVSTRGPIIAGMVEIVKTVDFIETDSVLEALILEAHLIKKHQPPYNTKEKDNKSFNYVVITNDDFPRVITMRGRELEAKNSMIKHLFGPFPQGGVLRDALNIVRKIFPFRDKCKVGQGKPCFNAQIGLCPGTCSASGREFSNSGVISKKEYAKTIRRIRLFFEGNKKTLIIGLEKEMGVYAKSLKFEDAGRIKKIIFALKHIQDVAVLKSDFLHASSISSHTQTPIRIEAYDVAHISGTNTVGVMVVLEDNEPLKSEYRKFKIKTSTNDDNASLREMLIRRLGHTEWQMPKLIVVDGGVAQVNTAEKVLSERGIDIPVVGVVKDEHHKPREILRSLPSPALGVTSPRAGLGMPDRLIILANSEAHRFAIGYHRLLRGKLK